MKLHGGALHNKKQKRNVKLHKNNFISYYDGNNLKGYFKITKETRIDLT